MNEEGVSRNLGLIALAVVVVIIIATFSGGFFSNESDEPPSYENSDYKLFVSENYNFSFPYPSTWDIKNYESSEMTVVIVSENSTSENSVARALIYAGSLGYPPLDKIRSQLENNENINIVGDVQEVSVDGVPGVDISFVSDRENQNTRARTRVLKKEGFECSISYYVQENYYERFKTGLIPVIENFSFIE